MNGGTCNAITGHCFCPTNFQGQFCQQHLSQNILRQNQPRNACQENADLCQNGATCIPVASTSFVCLCRSGFSGRHCDLVVNMCLKFGHFCGHREKSDLCQPINEKEFQCQCTTENATGAFCETNSCPEPQGKYFL